MDGEHDRFTRTIPSVTVDGLDSRPRVSEFFPATQRATIFASIVASGCATIAIAAYIALWILPFGALAPLVRLVFHVVPAQLTADDQLQYRVELGVCGALILIVALAVVGGLYYARVSAIRKHFERAEQAARLDRAAASFSQSPRDIGRAWDFARQLLEQYFNRNLSQVNSIYYVSVGVMAAGFLIIIVAIGKDASANDKAPGVIAGVLVEFIGATFLYLYRSIAQQTGNYFATLNWINAVGMAMTIVDSIQDASAQDALKGVLAPMVMQPAASFDGVSRPRAAMPEKANRSVDS